MGSGIAGAVFGRSWSSRYPSRYHFSLARSRRVARCSVEFEVAKDICEHYGHIVHGDPVSADWNRIPLDDGSLGYAVGKVLNNPALCDELALQGWAHLRIPVAR